MRGVCWCCSTDSGETRSRQGARRLAANNAGNSSVHHRICFKSNKLSGFVRSLTLFAEILAKSFVSLEFRRSSHLCKIFRSRRQNAHSLIQRSHLKQQVLRIPSTSFYLVWKKPAISVLKIVSDCFWQVQGLQPPLLDCTSANLGKSFSLAAHSKQCFQIYIEGFKYRTTKR